MIRSPKPPFNKKASSFSPELFEKIENLLDSLSAATESEVFEPNVLNLAEILDEYPALADFFFEKVLTRPDPRIISFLLKLDGFIHSKPVHKGIKRTLYLLKQRGMDIPLATEDRDEKIGRGGILKETVSAQVLGYLSEFDEIGNRMLALIVPQVSKGNLFVFALISQERSLESLTALRVSKKEAKGLLHDLEAQAGHSFLSADPGHVAFILKKAHDRKSNLSKEDEGFYAHIVNLLTGLKLVRQESIMYALFPTERSFLEIPPDWERITGIKELSYFMPKTDMLEPYQNAIRGVQEAILIISPSQKRQQIDEIVLRAARELFKGQEKENFVQYLEELAYLYYSKNQIDEAKLLWGAAFSSAQEGEGGPAAENPLLLWLVRRALSVDKIIEEDRDQGPALEKTSGGIIIPPWVKKDGGRD